MVWSLEKNSSILKLQQNELENKLNNLFKKYVSKLNIKNIQTQKLSFSYAKNMYQGKIVLIGNIAHNIHPIAGQGFNLTVKDISKIVYYITKYHSLGLDFNSKQVLESLQ